MKRTASTNPCICVPVYYLPELYLTIDKCLKSIKRCYPDWPLLILDDASPTWCPFEANLYNTVNKGFTYSVNRLLEEGLKLSDKVIIVNDDVEIRKGQLDRFKDIGDGIYSPADTASGDLETFGACWAINKRTFKKLGKLDEKYRNYFSDRDYFERAKKLKIPIVKWKDIVLIHHESATFNLIEKNNLLEQDLEIWNSR